MSIPCPSCQAIVPAANVDRGLMVARCSACNAVFDCSGHAEGAPAAPQRRRPPVPMPEAFTVSEGPREAADGGYREPATRGGPPVTIVRRWYAPVAWFLCVFLVFWFGILSRFMVSSADAPLLFRLFPLFHVAAGLYVAYWTLAVFLNKTTIRITDEALAIAHAPVPWPGSRSLPAGEVTQVFTEEKISKNKNGGDTRTYEVIALMRDGRREAIVKSLPEPAQALFLEQRIEERLGIADVEVGGEYPG